jgi:hypothetical protein
MTIPPRQNVAPLNYQTPIVNPETGMPTLQFIQLLQKLNSNESSATTDLTALQNQIDFVATEVDGLQASAVPPGGDTGEVLTKTGPGNYAMDWLPSPANAVYAPLVTGATPGPELVATGDGQCIMVQIG